MNIILTCKVDLQSSKVFFLNKNENIFKIMIVAVSGDCLWLADGIAEIF